MDVFGRFLGELVTNLGNDIYGVLIVLRDFILDLWRGFVAIFSNIGKALTYYRGSFDALGWILFGLIVIIVLGVLALLVYFIYRLIRMRFRVRRKYGDKKELLNEIDILNDKVLDLIDEKNKIMAMKVSQLGIKPGSKEADALKKLDKDRDIRFPKLTHVDRMYSKKETRDMTDEEKIDLKTFAEGFRQYSASRLNLFYTQSTINLFIASLGAADIMILEGISGTGKTSLPYAFGMYINNKSSIISVQPSWRDRSELIGYLNEFTKKFNESEFLREIYSAHYEKQPRIIVLDEMNLARIEYYFAEFLSMMEMPNPDDRIIDLVSEIKENDPKFIEEGKMRIPRNVWFVGTVNQDDSTFAVTDKVYDRAASIVLNKRADLFEPIDTEPIYIEYLYLQTLFDEAVEKHQIKKTNLKKIEELEMYMIQKFKIPFGNRIYRQINMFVPVFMACGGNELEALDYIFTRKVLRKLETLHAGFIQKPLKDMITLINKLFGRNEFLEAKQFIEDFLKGQM